MTTTSKYFVLPSTGANFIDYELSYGTVSLQGQEIVFVGSTTVDAVFVRPGVVVDFTLSGAGADKIYLAGNQADYSASLTGSVMTLTRGGGDTLETVRFIKATTLAASDQVVFADGTLSSFDLYNNLKNATPLPVLSGETSVAPSAPAATGSELNASIKAFALDASGETFALARPGISLTVVGGVGVDTVYVPDGGTVDATLLGGGSDLIYFRGNWGDYSKTVAGSVVTFSRSIDGVTESVKVIAGSTVTLNDKLIFADGAVLSNNAKLAVNANPDAAISAVTGYDAATVAPGIDSTPPTLDVAAVGDGNLTAAEATGAGGVVSVTSENGANISVEFTGTSGQITKHITGNGTAQTVTLDTNDLTALGNGAIAVATTATDAAGNVATGTDGGFNLDTSAPVLSKAEVNGNVLTLTYTEANGLDAVNKAATTDFTVLVNGNPVAVNSVAVNGNLVNLSLASSVANGSSMSVSYSGSGANAIQDAAGNDATTLSGQAVSVASGSLADGYIRDAHIYIDTDGDGGGDFDTGVSTNASGNFFLPPGTPAGTIIAIGGVNIDTGVPNTLVYKAPSGSTTVSPLTTLVQAYADANSVSAATAETAVQDALGLPAGVDLLTFDPLAASPTDADAVAVQIAATQIATIAMLAASAPAGGASASDAAQEVIDNLVTTVTGAGAVDLSDADTAAGLLGVSTSITATEVTDAAAAIGAAEDFSQISGAQAQALDHIAPAAPTHAPDLLAASDSGRLGNDDITRDNTPSVRVRINTDATDGTATVAGDSVKVFDGATQVGSGAISADDIANGFVDITASTLADGVHSLTATLTDIAGNTGTASAALSLNIDTNAPATTFGGLALSADTGGNTTDFLTKTAKQTVFATLSAPLAAGEFAYGSTNGGATWTDITGSINGTSLAWNTVLRDGANTLQLKSSDSAGNTGTIASQAYTLDTILPTLAVAGRGDNAKTVAEATDTGGVVTFNAENGSSVNMMFRNGAHTLSKTFTSDGNAHAVVLSVGDLTTLGDGTVSVTTTATDAAGNARLSTVGGFSLDTNAPGAPTINTVATDGIVNASEKAAGVGVSGTAENGASVAVTWGATSHTVTAVGGAWSTSFTAGEIPADGATLIGATASDAAGNLSSASFHDVSIDTLAPATTAAPTLSASSDTGVLGDGITSDTTPTLSGTGEANAAIVLLDDLGGGAFTVLATATANAAGAWSITSSALSEGTHHLIANASDAAFNVASYPVLDLTIVPPAGPDLTAPTLQSATINGNLITLTYNEALDPAHQSAASFFLINVTGNGTSRTVFDIAINGNTVVLSLLNAVSPGDVVTLNYADATGGNDVFAVQDLVGNDAAGFSGIALTNLTSVDVSPPDLVAATFTESANASVTLTYSEAMQASNPGNLAIYKNGIGSSILTGVSGISGGAVTFTTNATLGATDYVVVTYNGGGDLRDSNNQYVGQGSVVIGGSGSNSANLSELDWSKYSTPIIMRGNGGADTLVGSNNNDRLNGGGGSDTLNGGWGQDHINLNETTRASDTVVAADDKWSSGSQPYFYDTVHAFDVSNNGGVNNDKLNLPSGTIAANASHINGADVGSLAQHSIAAGILGFENAAGNAILINSGNLKAATDYLEANVGKAGDTVGFAFDADGNGHADSLFVFQNQGGSDIDNDTLMLLTGVNGVTLGNSAGQNVVQIVDTAGPTINDADFTANTLNLYFSETVASVDLAGLTLQKGNGTTLGALTPTGSTLNGNQIAVTLSNANLTGADYVLVTPTDRTHQNATDSFGNAGTLFAADEAGGAIGGSGDTVINLSGLSGNYFLYDPDGGNDTLTGNTSDNELHGGAGNDTLNGNAGNDELDGGQGADTMNGGDGADQFNFEQGDSTPVSFSNGTYTFTGGADVVAGAGFTVVPTNNNSETGDRISLRSPIPGSSLSAMAGVPVDGLATDQGYYLARGNYSAGVFTANTAGADTLVVYDGNPANGAVSQTALVVQGIDPTQLATTNWGDIYYSGSGAAGTSLAISSFTANGTVNEGNSGTTAVTFQITRAGDTLGSTSVDWSVVTTPSSATVDTADFVGGVFAQGSVTFAAGEVAKTLIVNIAGDTATESNETFGVRLSNPSGGAGLSFPETQVVILNDDGGSGDTTPPTSTGASFTNSANSVITLTYNEAVTASNPAGVSLSLNPSEANNWNGTAIGINGTPTGLGTSTLGIPTSATLGGTDVVRLRYDAGSGDLRDLSNNAVPSGEIFFGGNGDNTINLDYYWSGVPVTLRGNGGNDTLVGTQRNDLLIDGGGMDTLLGRAGADRIVLVENGTIAFSRDVVMIGIGDSYALYQGVDNSATHMDIIISSLTSPTTSGFDITSATAANHDALDLPSNTIAANISHADGIDAGSIAKHSITGGIVTFEDVSGNAIQIGSANPSAATSYLVANFTTPGVTAAFKIDTDGNSSVDSLIVFQDNGTIPLAGNFVLPDTMLLISQLAGIADATLGTTAGANVVQIQDTQTPEPVGMALTSDGMSFNFTENAFTPANAADLALTMQKNGTGTVFSPSSVDGNGSPNMTLHYAGVSLAPEDWAMMRYAGTGTNNALRDAAGNALIEEAGGFGFAEGGSGNNSINLSALSEGYDLNGNAGNDSLIGSSGSDWITGGTGADTMTGGNGSDEFSFEQGDSPAVSGMNLGGDSTLNTGDTFSFVNGVDRVTDLSSGEAIELSKPMSDLLGEADGLSYLGSAPANGLATNQGYFAVQGNFSGGVFTVNTASGSDTLLVYDGDSGSGVSQTGIVLSGVQAGQLQLGGGWIQLSSTSGFSNANDTYALPAPSVIGQTVDAQGGSDTLALASYPDMIVPDGQGLHFGEILDPASISTSSIVYTLDSDTATSYHLSGIHNVLAVQPVTDYDITLNNFEHLRFDDGTHVLDINLATDVGLINANQAVSGVLDGNTLAANYLFASYEVGAGVSQVIGGADLADTAGLFFEVVSGEIQMAKDESVPDHPVWRFNEGTNEVFSIRQSGSDWTIDYDYNGAGTDVTLSNIEYAAVLNTLDNDAILLRLSFEASQPIVIA